MTEYRLAQPVEALKAMSDTQLRSEKLAYKVAMSAIENQIDAHQAAHAEPPRELRSAWRHYRTGLGLIKEIFRERHAQSAELTSHVGELYRAVGAMLDDDSDANWERLQTAYEAMPTPHADRVDA